MPGIFMSVMMMSKRSRSTQVRCLEAAASQGDRVLVEAQDVVQEQADAYLVVDDEDAPAADRRRRSRRDAVAASDVSARSVLLGAAPIGSSMWKTAPPPAGFSVQMRPPCSSMML